MSEAILSRRVKNEIQRDWDFPNGIYERFVLDKIDIGTEKLFKTTRDEVRNARSFTYAVKLFFKVKFLDKYETVTIIINTDYP